MNGRRNKVTVTGGRDATQRHIPGDAVLSVCRPSTLAVPKGWQWHHLGEIAKMESGHTPSRKHPEYWGGDIPWIAVGDAGKNHGGVILDTVEHTNQLGIDNSSARLLPKGTVCLSRGGTVGYVTVLGRPMATSQGFANWICGDKIDPFFLKYIFLREADALDRFAIGATIQTIYYPDIKAFHVCVPSLAEQQRIVGVLDEAFAGLATAQAHAAQNLQNARALFESHLQSVFTHRGKGWVEKTLGDVCEFVGGSQPPKAVFSKTRTPNSIRLIQIRDYKSDKHVVYIPKAQARRFCTADDIMIGRYGPPIFQILRGLEGAYNVALMKAVPDETQVNREFLFYFLKHPAILQHVIYRSERAAGQIGVTKETLAPYPIALPSLDKQADVAADISALASDTQQLARIYEQKQAALAELKKSLLHQAFSGNL